MQKYKNAHLPAKYLFALQVLIVTLIIPIGHSTAGCPDDLTALWHLEEATNTPPYRDELTALQGSCTLPENCPARGDAVVGTGQVFDGNDGILIPADPVFNWNTDENFTVELWMKRQAGLAANEILVGRDDPTSSMLWWIGIGTSGKTIFSLTSSGGEAPFLPLEGTKRLDNGLWHHIVAVREKNAGIGIDELRLYVDGRLEDQVSVSYNSGFESTAPVTVGYLSTNGTNTMFFNGSIDELAFHNNALDEATIQSHYYLALGYCDLYERAIEIMPLGDSITYDTIPTDLEPGGRPSGERTGYRQPLWYSLSDSEYWVDFVGSKMAGEDVLPPFDPDNAGFGGVSDDDLYEIMNSGYNPRKDIQESPGPYLQNHPTDVILLHIGTNYITPDVSGLENILDEIDEYSEHITVILARIVQRVPYPHSPTVEFNANLVALAQNRITNGDKIIIANMETGAGLNYTIYNPDKAPNGDFFDDLHLLPDVPGQGYTKMATVWFKALDQFLPPSSPPLITSTPVATVNIQTAYFYDVDAQGLPRPTFSLTGDPPPGMVIDTDSGVIEWTPGLNAFGEYDVSVVATSYWGPDIYGTDTQEFTLQVTGIPNNPPSITETTPLSTAQNTAISVSFNHLTVVDSDNTYPDGFSIKLYGGANYSVQQVSGKNVILPATNFIGKLMVPVSVNDGRAESNIASMEVSVKNGSSSSGCFIDTIKGE